MSDRPSPDRDRVRERRQAARVQRNFWLLVAATVLAVGVLSQALRGPAGPAAGVVVALSGLAAIISLTLAGRILTVTTGRRRRPVEPPRSSRERR